MYRISLFLYKSLLFLRTLRLYLIDFDILRFDLFYRNFHKKYYDYYRNQADRSRVNKPASDLVYGEMTHVGLTKIFKYAPLDVNSYFIDMGSGLGSTAMFVNLFFQARVLGVDILPFYTQFSSACASSFGLNFIEFRCEDFLFTDLQYATHILVPLTCLTEESKNRIIHHLKSANIGCYIISTTYQINDPKFKYIKSLVVPASWGQCTIYIHRIVDDIRIR